MAYHLSVLPLYESLYPRTVLYLGHFPEQSMLAYMEF